MACANTPGNQQSPINFQTMGSTGEKFVKIPKDEGAMTFSGHKWCVRACARGLVVCLHACPPARPPARPWPAPAD